MPIDSWIRIPEQSRPSSTTTTIYYVDSFATESEAIEVDTRVKEIKWHPSYWMGLGFPQSGNS